MIKVTRKSYHLENETESKETRYYITNYDGKITEIVDVIRGHWKIDIMNRIRVVNFGEDKFIIFKSWITKNDVFFYVVYL